MQKRDAASDEEHSDVEEVDEEEGEFTDSEDESSEDEVAEEGEEGGEEEEEEGEEDGEQAEEGAEQEAEEEPAPPLKPVRKRLEPFEVPKSGAFWLHDDRFDGGEEGAGADGGEAGAEQDERQKERGKLWDPSSKERWGHDAFEALERGEEPTGDLSESFGRMRMGGRGRGGRGGRGRGRFDAGQDEGYMGEYVQEQFPAPGRGGRGGRGRGGRGGRGGSSTDVFVIAADDDVDFPPPGFEGKQPGPAAAPANGRGGAGGGRGARPASRGSAGNVNAPKVIAVPRSGGGGGAAAAGVASAAGAAAAAPPKSPGNSTRRRRSKQLNVEAQNFQPSYSQAAAAPRPAPAAAPAPAPAPAEPAQAPAHVATMPPVPVYTMPEQAAMPQPTMPPAQQPAPPPQPAPAPAVAAAQMSAQQSAAALQQIAMGGGFAPAIMQQPMQPQQQAMPAQQQPMAYMMQQPMQFAHAPGMQPGYAYVVQYPALGMQAMPQPMPTYQPAYQPMEAPAMPAAPLPPQAVKRPLTITAPDDGAGAGASSVAASAGMHYAQYTAAPAAYAGVPQVQAHGEALAQRTTPAGGGRRYSAVAREGA